MYLSTSNLDTLTDLSNLSNDTKVSIIKPNLDAQNVLILTCPLCSYCTHYYNSLTIHFEQQHRGRNASLVLYQCTFCEKVSCSENFLWEHIQMAHYSSNSLSFLPTTSSTYKVLHKGVLVGGLLSSFLGSTTNDTSKCLAGDISTFLTEGATNLGATTSTNHNSSEDAGKKYTCSFCPFEDNSFSNTLNHYVSHIFPNGSDLSSTKNKQKQVSDFLSNNTNNNHNGNNNSNNISTNIQHSNLASGLFNGKNALNNTTDNIGSTAQWLLNPSQSIQSQLHSLIMASTTNSNWLKNMGTGNSIANPNEVESENGNNACNVDNVPSKEKTKIPKSEYYEAIKISIETENNNDLTPEVLLKEPAYSDKVSQSSTNTHVEDGPDFISQLNLGALESSPGTELMKKCTPNGNSANGANANGRSHLPFQSKKILFQWLSEHIHEPYPTEEEKSILSKTSGLSKTTVNNWFINARRRYVRPLLDGRVTVSSQHPLVSSSSVGHSGGNSFIVNDSNASNTAAELLRNSTQFPE